MPIRVATLLGLALCCCCCCFSTALAGPQGGEPLWNKTCRNLRFANPHKSPGGKLLAFHSHLEFSTQSQLSHKTRGRKPLLHRIQRISPLTTGLRFPRTSQRPPCVKERPHARWGLTHHCPWEVSPQRQTPERPFLDNPHSAPPPHPWAAVAESQSLHFSKRTYNLADHPF